MARLKPVGFEDRLSLVEHLDELRTRIIVSVSVLVVAFGLCFWQNHLLLDIANNPLPGHMRPLTFSPTEPFFTTMTLSLYAALILALPLILYQAYAFVVPAFSPTERGAVIPIVLMIPFLFIGGVVFGYFVVLPAAIKFLLHFNQGQFNIEIRAREYYSFVSMTMLAMGVLFQLPVAVLALTRLGVVTPRQLRKNRRIAIVVCAIVAALLPGTDPVTMLIEMLPLVVLYEVSILLASAFGTPSTSRWESDPPAEHPV
jgi:sec-independent protein translocase protein TatC